MAGLVETQGKCLFCLEKVEKSCSSGGFWEDEDSDMNNDSGGSLEQERVSLRHIFHYLQLKLTKEQLQEWDFSVQLCGKCGKMAERLTDMCRQLELMQMKVDYLVEELFLIITLSGLPSEDFMENGGDREVGLSKFAELLRTKTRKRATAALDRSRQPQIKLRRVDGEDDEFLDGEFGDDVSKNIEAEVESPQSEVRVMTPVESFVTFDTASLEDPKSHTCPFCNQFFSDSLKLKFHTTLEHLDQFFSSARLSGISEATFKIICDYQMKKESDRRVPNGFFGCPHCPTTYKERRRMISHLVDYHYELMVEKLTELQRKNEFDIQFNTTKLISCEMCSQKFSQFDALVIHWKKDHPNRTHSRAASNNVISHPVVEQFLQNLPKTQIGKENRYICGLCPRLDQVHPTIICHLYVLKRHALHTHTEMLFLSVKQPEVPLTMFKNYCNRILKVAQQISKSVVKQQMSANEGVEVQKLCYFCNSVFTDPRTLQRHLIQVHFEHLRNELQKLQELETRGMMTDNNSENRKCALCEKMFNNIIELADHMQLEHNESTQVLVNTLPKCRNCNVYFSCQATLSEHEAHCYKAVKSSHTFVSPDSSQIKSGTQCKLCGTLFPTVFSLTQHIMNKHVNDAHLVDNTCLKCPLCDVQFSSKTNLNRHLRENCNELYKHKDIVTTTPTPTKVACKHCGEWFKNKQALGGHLARNHREEKNLISTSNQPALRPKCPNCHEDFFCKSNLERHLKENCEALKNLGLINHKPKPRNQRACPYCGVTLYDQSNLRRHVLRKHPGMEVTTSTKSTDGISNLSINNVTSLSSSVTTPTTTNDCQVEFEDDDVQVLEFEEEDHEYQLNIADFLDIAQGEAEDSKPVGNNAVVNGEALTFHNDIEYVVDSNITNDQFLEEDPLQM